MNALLAAIAVVGVSASGPLMAATPAGVLAIAFWRNALAVAVIAPVALGRRHEIGALTGRQRLLAVASGLFLAVHFAAWIGALQLTTVAAATALVTTQVVWIVLLDRLRGVPVRAAVLVGCALAVVGVLVVSGVDFQTSRRALVGDLLAVVGGLAAALYLVVGERLRVLLSTPSYTTLCYGTCALALGAAALLTGADLVQLSPRAWLLIVAVTIAAQLLGHSLINHLLASMSPMVLSLLLLLEVPGAALLAAWALGQSPPMGVLGGLVLVLVGLAVVVVRRKPQPVPEGY